MGPIFVTILVSAIVAVPASFLGIYLAERRVAKRRLPLMGISEMRKRYRGAGAPIPSEKEP